MPDIETLICDGFAFESLAIRGETLSANYGSGYGEGVVIGNPAGLQTWRLRAGVLPNSEGDDLLDAGDFGWQTRFAYLFDFYVRHNVAAARKVFWVGPHGSALVYLAEIVEEELDFQQFCATVFSTGLTLRQRRIFGIASPKPATGNNTPEL